MRRGDIRPNGTVIPRSVARDVDAGRGCIAGNPTIVIRPTDIVAAKLPGVPIVVVGQVLVELANDSDAISQLRVGGSGAAGT